nr:hypothetical protein [Tanacetum cinerariifolium]
MRPFSSEFRTTNELLFKERNNSLSKLRFKVHELLRVIDNALILNFEVKGVTTRCGKTTTQDVQNDNTNMSTAESPKVHHDKPVESKNVPGNNQPRKTNEQVVQPSIKAPTPSVPFPLRLRKEKEEAQQRKLLENLKQLHLNLPFIEALAQMPKYTKFLKSLLTKKARLEEACTITMNERYSVVLLNKLPSKEKDPGSFTIPYDVGHLYIDNALVDLEASISFIPYKMYEKLGLGEPKPTRMSLELADRVPIILGRLVLATARAMIDVFNKKITFRVGDDEVIFDVDQPMKRPSTEDDECYGVDDLDDMINIGTQELLANYGSDTFLLKGLEKSINQSDLESYNLVENKSDKDPDLGIPIRRINSIDTAYSVTHQTAKLDGVKIKHLYSASTNEIDEKKSELKDLPQRLEYAYLHGDKSLPIIISSKLSKKEKMSLLHVLEKHKGAMLGKYSSWVSPIHVVPKKGRIIVVLNDNNELIPSRTVIGWRVCIDYHKCNDATRKDHFPLPFIDQMLKRLSRNEYYCFLDSFSGFFQIPIAPKEKEKTTFTCPYGTFAYRRMSFRLCNTPATFQRCMTVIFHNMVEDFMEVFMDDLSVFGNSFKCCLANLDRMLARCEETNLVLNWEKYHFMVKEGIVLGHKIYRESIEVDRAKINVIAKLPYPTNVKGLRSFLGHAGFYRRVTILLENRASEMETRKKKVFLSISLSPQVVSAAKLPILNPYEIDLWKMRIEQYFLMTDYSLWEVILNGDSPAPIRVVEGVLQPVAPTTAEQKLARKNELKARDVNLKFLLSLSSAWKTHTFIWQNKADLEEQSLDDLFNSLKIYEVKVKHSSSTGTTTQNLAFMSSSNTDSTTESVSAVASVLAICAKMLVSSLPNVDSLSNARTGRNLGANRPTSMGFDMSKVECYNCHRKGYFAREYRSPKDSRRNGSYDWSIQAEEEPVNYAFMDFSSSSSSSYNEEVSCSKSCSKAYAQLHSQCDKLTADFRKSQFDVISYQTGLESIEARLLIYKQNEFVFEEDIQLLKLESDESWPPRSLYDRFQPSDGYHAVPPPYPGKFMPPKPDLVFNIAPTVVESDHSAFNHVKTSIPVATLKPASLKPTSNGKRMNSKACFVCKSLDHLIKNCDYHEKKMAQPTPRNHAHRGKIGMETKMPNSRPCFPQHKCINDPKKGNPQHALKDKGVIDSGRSRHMTGNMSCLYYFEVLNGGYVAFGGNPKGGKISRKGKIKTGKLDFDDVYFVNKLKFNFFSLSQMCDKKNSVLFTDTECLVLSPDFKLPDESQVLLRVPRKNNMYNVNLKKIVPSGDLTCLFAKAIIDESNLWHRRLGHINFKTINKLVKGNLVRGLPTKVFENDNTYVACKKGKQHRTSCKTKPFCGMMGIKREFSVPRTPQQNGIAERKNKTLIEAARTMLADSLPPILFWAEVVNTACYVQNRVLVTKPHNKTPYELLHGRTPSIGFMRPFGYLVTILNTLDSLGKFDEKVDEGFLVGYFVSSKAFRVFNSRTRIIQETLHVIFLENKPNVASSGPTWLFDIDSLTRTMNYQSVTAGNQSNPSNSDGDTSFDRKEPDFDAKKSESEVIISPSSSAQSKKQDDKTKREAKGKSPVESFIRYRDLNAEFEDYSDNSINEVNVAELEDMPELEDITYSDDEDDVGAEVDFNNLETSIIVNHIPTTRFHKDHPIYVDDIIFGVTNKDLCKSFKKLMKDKFQISSMGELTFFLGLQVKQKKDEIFNTQDKYVAEILRKFGLTEGKSASTPIDTKKPLLKDPDGEDVDVHTYRLMIGSLMYLTSLRPDIMFAVCACVRLQVTPKASHLHAVKRIFRYLKDAEYVAAASCYAQVLWIQNPLLDYGIKRYIDTKPNNELIHYCLKNPPYKLDWQDIEVPVSKGSPITTTERIRETYKNVSQDIRDQLNAEAEAVQIILTGIDNDIYSTVDACSNACEMWKAIEMLKQGESINVQDLETNLYWEFRKFTSQDGESLESYYSRMAKHEVNEIRAEKKARIANPLALVAQQQPVYHPQNHPTHYTQNSSTRSQQAATRNRGNAIVNSPQPIYDQETSMIAEDEEKENVGSSVVQKSRIQCYNCKEYGHVARECQKAKTSKGCSLSQGKGVAMNRKRIICTWHNFKRFFQMMLTLDLSLMMNHCKREEINQNDDDNDLSKERELLASLIEKLKCEIDESKNRNKFLEISNKIKIYKPREDKELDKVIELENKVKILDNIVYKIGQSVQTMNMLNNKCRTSFAKPEFLKKAQRANPRLHDIGVIPTTSVSRPQLKSNPQGDTVMHNNSQGKKQEVEDHRRSVKLSKNKTSVIACNDSLNAKTLNVKSVSAMCDKCVLQDW